MLHVSKKIVAGGNVQILPTRKNHRVYHYSSQQIYLFRGMFQEYLCPPIKSPNNFDMGNFYQNKCVLHEHGTRDDLGSGSGIDDGHCYFNLIFNV